MNAIAEIDVRGLTCPEPFELIVAALHKLVPGEILKVLIHREPFPLYDMMRKSGYTWTTKKLEYNSFKIEINRLR